MKFKSRRLFFYLPDMMRISGRSEKTSRKKLNEIRKHYQLAPYQELTFYHVAGYLNVAVETLY